MKSVQQLIAWLIPAQLLTLSLQIGAQAFSTRYRFFGKLGNDLPAGVLSHAWHIYSTLTMISSLSYLLCHIVIGTWLGMQRHDSPGGRWLWFFFGFLVGYWALGIYLILMIPTLTGHVLPRASEE